MNYGVILLAIALIFAIIGKQTRVKNSFLIISTTLFLGFSYNMGGDWRSYKVFYEESIPKLSVSSLMNVSFEKGYILLNYTFNKLYFNYEFFQGIILISCIYTILKLLEKKAKNFYVAFVYIFIQLLFPYSTEPILRQFISVTLIILSFKYIEEKKFFKYLFLIFLAFNFHKSSIIGIFFYFFNYLNFRSKKKIILSVILVILISFNTKFILESVINIIPFLRKYSVYLSDEKYSTSLLGSLYLIIIICIYLGIIIYTQYEKRYKIYLNLAIVGILFGIYATHFFILIRLNSYFSFPIAIAISNIDRIKFDLKLKKICIFLVIFIQIFIKYYTTSQNVENRKRYYYYQNYLIEILRGKQTRSYYLRENFIKDLSKATVYD